MGDLDVGLIKEFANRPAFYNKTSPHYKDKVFVERAWLDISHKLGYNVTLLKDRMYQLRNRYNLEKRKVENMRAEGQKNPKSSWPLFQNLNFLDGHIRPRKSYKTMMKRSVSPQDDKEIPMVEIKFERGDDDDVNALYNGYETEDDDIVNNDDDDNFVNPANLLTIDDSESENDQNADTHTTNSTKNSSSVPHHNNMITLRNINSLKRSLNDEITALNNDLQRPAAKRQKDEYHQSSDKFNAFGAFLTSALLDMPEKRALELVEKFTNELVKALLEKEQK